MVRLFTSACRLEAGRQPASQALQYFLCLAGLAAFALSVQGANFTAALDRDSILLGETASLTLTYEDCPPQRVPALPQIPNLRFAYLGPSQQTTIINGQQKSTVTLRFTVTPQQPGDFTIPALHFDFNGQQLSTPPLQLKVLREDPSAPPAALASQPAFLWLVLPKKEYYLHEVIVAELRLYLRSGLRIGNPQIPTPTGDGFTAAKLTQGQQYQRALGGVPFTIIPLSLALTPVKTGVLTLQPLSGSVVLNPRDPFDFDSFFRRPPPPQEIPLRVEQQEVRVLPLPSENVPPGFSGAVGNYTLSFSAGPTNVAVGDPITVKVRVSGRGALDTVTLPEQRAWTEFKTYPPTASVETSDPLGIQGARSFEQVVVPQSTDIRELPGVAFSFFDPEAKAYRALSQPAVPLTVRPGGATPTPVIAAAKSNTEDAPPPTQDIVGIKQRPGTLATTPTPLALRPTFWGINSLPLLTWLASVVWRKRADSLARNPRLRRKRQVAQLVNEGLEELRQSAAENKSDAFFAALFRLLQEQIGERLDVPASSITEAVVDERLKPAGLPDSACGSLHELFQACNLARYAPVKSSEELAAHVPRLEAVVLQLRRLES